MNIQRRPFLALVMAFPAASWSQGSQGSQGSQAWPMHALKIVCGFPPGQSSDIAARVIAEELGSVLGQPVIVENRPGAGATLAHEWVARSAPDGYTLLIGVPGALTMAPSLYPKLGYDPLRDFEPVGMTGVTPYVFVVNPDFPAKALAEAIALGKEPSGASINYGSSGNGSGTHLQMERLKMLTGARFTHVPYRGSGPALTDLMAGNIQVMVDSLTATLPLIRTGRLRALGVSTLKPVAELPGVPTMAATIPGYEFVAAGTLMVPAATPRPVIDRLTKAIAQVHANPKTAEKLLAQGVYARNDPPETIKRDLKAETKIWAQVVQAAGVKLD